MPENNKCSILIDGTKGTARITISGRDAKSVGVLYPGYVMGQPITVQEGSKRMITLYNGLQKGTISFDLIFSGAKNIAASGVALLSMALLS